MKEVLHASTSPDGLFTLWSALKWSSLVTQYFGYCSGSGVISQQCTIAPLHRSDAACSQGQSHTLALAAIRVPTSELLLDGFSSMCHTVTGLSPPPHTPHRCPCTVQDSWDITFFKWPQYSWYLKQTIHHLPPSVGKIIQVLQGRNWERHSKWLGKQGEMKRESPDMYFCPSPVQTDTSDQATT